MNLFYNQTNFTYEDNDRVGQKQYTAFVHFKEEDCIEEIDVLACDKTHADEITQEALKMDYRGTWEIKLIESREPGMMYF